MSHDVVRGLDLQTTVGMNGGRVPSVSADMTFDHYDSARGVGFDATLARRTNDLVRVNLRRAPSSELRVDLRRVPSAPVRVYNDLGTTARYFDAGRTKQVEIDTAYRNLRALVAPNADKVNFNHSKMTVWYRLSDGTEHVKDLQEMVNNDPAIRDAFEILDDLVRPLWGGPLRGQFIEAGSKSSSLGMRAMERSNVALQSFPKDKYSDSAKLALHLYSQKVNDPAKQEAALKRITAIERILDPQVKTVKTRLTQERALLANSATPQTQHAQIQARIRELEALEKKLDVDRLALYVAAAFTPQPDPIHPPTPSQALANAERAAKDAQEVLQRHFDSVRNAMMHEGVKSSTLHKIDMLNVIPKFIKGEVKDIPDNKAYSIDAAALVFSSLPIALARKGALDFWKSHQASQKIDTLEDELIRFALAGDATIPQLERAIARVTDPSGTLANTLAGSKVVAQNILNGTATYPPTVFPLTATSLDAKVDHVKTGYAFE